MGKKYQQRVSELVRRKITQLLAEESNDPRLAEVTITDVTVNRDTSRAEVYFSLIGTPDDVAEMQTALDGAAGWLRMQLGSTLRLRNIPKPVFIYDPSLQHGDRMEALFHELHGATQADDRFDATDAGDDVTEAE